VTEDGPRTEPDLPQLPDFARDEIRRDKGVRAAAAKRREAEAKRRDAETKVRDAMQKEHEAIAKALERATKARTS
jgi:hypothetical protein